MNNHRIHSPASALIIACMALTLVWWPPLEANPNATISKLNHDLAGWDVLDFQISPDGEWVVFHTDDYAHSGLEALYSVPASAGASPEILYAQTAGAALGVHEYRIAGDSTRMVIRGDIETDGVVELFSLDLVPGLFVDDFESGELWAAHRR